MRPSTMRKSPMSNDAWGILFCFILPLSIAITAIAILLYGWRTIAAKIGNLYYQWLQGK